MVENNTESCGAGYCGRGRSWKALTALGFAGTLLVLAMLVSEVKSWDFIGLPTPQQATISVDGKGEEYGKPDIALVSFSVVAEGKTVAEAQTKATEAMSKSLAFLKGAGVDEKDIKTTGYNFNPRYEWHEVKIICITYPCNQPPGKQVLVGYEVSQSIDVKIRKIDDAGKILGGLGETGATNVSGLTFAVEHPEELQATARKEAIDEARAKADKLAKDLGVTIIRIVSYGEGGDTPVYNFARADGMAMGASEKAAPEIPAGENKFMSNVTITYEIK